MASIMKGRSVPASHADNYDKYAGKKENAQEVYRQGLQGQSLNEINAEFRERRELHSGLTNTDFAFELAPEPNSWGNVNAQEYINEFLDRLCAKLSRNSDRNKDTKSVIKKDDLQCIFFSHDHMNVSDIRHFHGRVSRILSDGSVINDRHIGKLCKEVSEDMDKKRQYKTAEDIGKEIKAETKRRAHEALREAAKGQKRGSFSLDRFKMFCESFGLNMEVSESSTGSVSGYWLQLDDGEYHTRNKVSDIDRNLTLKRIPRLFDKYVDEEKKREQEEARKQEIERQKQENLKKQEEKKNDRKPEQQKPRWHRHFGR